MGEQFVLGNYLGDWSELASGSWEAFVVATGLNASTTQVQFSDLDQALESVGQDGDLLQLDNTSRALGLSPREVYDALHAHYQSLQSLEVYQAPKWSVHGQLESYTAPLKTAAPSTNSENRLSQIKNFTSDVFSRGKESIAKILVGEEELGSIVMPKMTSVLLNLYVAGYVTGARAGAHGILSDFISTYADPMHDWAKSDKIMGVMKMCEDILTQIWGQDFNHSDEMLSLFKQAKEMDGNSEAMSILIGQSRESLGKALYQFSQKSSDFPEKAKSLFNKPITAELTENTRVLLKNIEAEEEKWKKISSVDQAAVLIERIASGNRSVREQLYGKMGFAIDDIDYVFSNTKTRYLSAGNNFEFPDRPSHLTTTEYEAVTGIVSAVLKNQLVSHAAELLSVPIAFAACIGMSVLGGPVAGIAAGALLSASFSGYDVHKAHEALTQSTANSAVSSLSQARLSAEPQVEALDDDLTQAYVAGAFNVMTSPMGVMTGGQNVSSSIVAGGMLSGTYSIVDGRQSDSMLIARKAKYAYYNYDTGNYDLSAEEMNDLEDNAAEQSMANIAYSTAFGTIFSAVSEGMGSFLLRRNGASWEMQEADGSWRSVEVRELENGQYAVEGVDGKVTMRMQSTSQPAVNYSFINSNINDVKSYILRLVLSARRNGLLQAIAEVRDNVDPNKREVFSAAVLLAYEHGYGKANAEYVVSDTPETHLAVLALIQGEELRDESLLTIARKAFERSVASGSDKNWTQLTYAAKKLYGKDYPRQLMEASRHMQIDFFAWSKSAIRSPLSSDTYLIDFLSTIDEGRVLLKQMAEDPTASSASRLACYKKMPEAFSMHPTYVEKGLRYFQGLEGCPETLRSQVKTSLTDYDMNRATLGEARALEILDEEFKAIINNIRYDQHRPQGFHVDAVYSVNAREYGQYTFSVRDGWVRDIEKILAGLRSVS